MKSSHWNIWRKLQQLEKLTLSNDLLIDSHDYRSKWWTTKWKLETQILNQQKDLK